MKLLVTYLIGLTFGVGITISGMGNPAKVVNFFDFFGTWDPSLGLVMGGALAVAAVGYQIVFRRSAPIYQPTFTLPKSRVIDTRLVAGSAAFGVGWGISGYCPGGAIPLLGTGRIEVFLFFGAMTGGILLARYVLRKTLDRTLDRDLRADFA